MILDELAYSIINTAKGGGIRTDDSRLNSRLVKYWIQQYRNFVIPEATAFGKDIQPQLIQDLGCLTLTKVDKGECGDSANPVLWGCDIKKVTIPALVDLPKDRGLVFVGLIDKQTPIEVVSSETAHLQQHRMITSQYTRAYRIGTTLYVITPENERLTYINVRGVFDDPTKVTFCPSGGGTCVCFDEATDQYPIPDIYITKVLEQIYQKELRLTMGVPTDVTNDNKEAIYAQKPTTAKQ
jgi:hypothetical protein